MKRRIVDRLMLIGVATAALATFLLFEIVTGEAGWNVDSQAFVVFTLFWFSVLAYLARQWVKTSHPPLHRRWPIVLAYVALFATHSAVLGTVLYRFRPHWNALGWLIVFTVELPLLLFGLHLAYEYCKTPRPLSIRAFIEYVSTESRHNM